MSNLKIEHYTCQTQEPYEQWLERKVQEYEHSHPVLVHQRDLLKEALEKLIKKCEDEVVCGEGCWHHIRETVYHAEKALDAVKEKT